MKHNSHSTRQPLQVRIFREGYFVVVTNRKIPLVGKSPATHKVGLKNLRERYELLHLKPQIENSGETFEVKVPIIKK